MNNIIYAVIGIVGLLITYQVPTVAPPDMNLQEVREDTVIVELNGEMIGQIEEVTYDLELAHIFVVIPDLQCLKDSDRMFSDRFQDEIMIHINDGDAVAMRRFEYKVGIRVLEIDTSEPLICEENTL